MKIYFDDGDDNYDNFDAENCDDYDHDVIYDDYAENWHRLLLPMAMTTSTCIALQMQPWWFYIS